MKKFFALFFVLSLLFSAFAFSPVANAAPSVETNNNNTCGDIEGLADPDLPTHQNYYLRCRFCSHTIQCDFFTYRAYLCSGWVCNVCKRYNVGLGNPGDGSLEYGYDGWVPLEPNDGNNNGNGDGPIEGPTVIIDHFFGDTFVRETLDGPLASTRDGHPDASSRFIHK